MSGSQEPNEGAVHSLGKYDVIEEVGRGSSGIVFKAVQRPLDRVVALKILAPHLTSDAVSLARFESEARTIARLNHPRIVQIYDVEQVGQTRFLCLEYCEAGSLADRLQREGSLEPGRALAVLSEIVEGLAVLHEHGILHRDLKSSNILFGEDGRAKITDFGISRVFGADRLTMEDYALGTAEYMSPEQCRGDTIDSRSDLYSAGVIAFEMATGKPPFAGATPFAVANKQMYESPPLEDLKDLPAGYARIIRKLLEKNPEDRYSDATALLEELNELRDIGQGAASGVSAGKGEAPVGGGARASREGGVAEHATTLRRRVSRVVVLAAAVVVVAAAIVLVLIRIAPPGVRGGRTLVRQLTGMRGKQLAPMNEARQHHTATLLADGSVLVAGGVQGGERENLRPVARLEVYSPTAGRFSTKGPLATARFNHTATRLATGEVLIAGGEVSFARTSLASVELYLPAYGETVEVPSMNAGRRRHCATLLADGNVLITGGQDEKTSRRRPELFDSTGREFVPLRHGLDEPRQDHTATLLADGRVLVAGGQDFAGHVLASAEFYDPKTDNFVKLTGRLRQARCDHTAMLLGDGRVLLVGGQDESRRPLRNTELFDPATESFSEGPEMEAARRFHASCLLPSGEVLAVGGTDSRSGEELPSIEVYDPGAGRWYAGSRLPRNLWNLGVCALEDGNVLICGGYSSEKKDAVAEAILIETRYR